MKKSTKIAIAAVLTGALAVCGFTSCKKTEQVSKSADTAYTILQLTDVHIQNDEKKDNKAFKSITKMVEATNPDLIVVTGDITSEHDNLTAFQKFGPFIEAFNIPWAFTYGNHDAEGQEKKEVLDEYLLSLENCVYERGDESVDGHGNYYRNVTDADGKVIMSLIMMDSNMYDEENDGYDHFHDNQIAWYENTIKSIAKEVNGDESEVVPSLAFFHIPMQEFTTAYDEAKGTDKRISGFRFEKAGSPAKDDNMFETMVELGSTKGVFVGHDHMNDYSVEYQGIRLTYSNSSDHNIYVVPMRGGNLIRIKNDGTFTTSQLFVHRVTGKLTIKDEK